MHSDEILLLGIGIQHPWRLVDQHLDTSTQPHELHLNVERKRGTRYACPSAVRSARRMTSPTSAGVTWIFSNIIATSPHLYRGSSAPSTACT